MIFNIMVDRNVNRIIGVSEGFEVTPEFFNKFQNKPPQPNEDCEDIAYYSLVDTDFDLLKEHKEDWEKVYEEINVDTILYPNELESKEWKINHSYNVNDTIFHDGLLYRVVQAHKSQGDWLPDKAPSLYVLMGKQDTAGKIKEWIQPTGAHNAYNIGDKVSFNGKIYESLINGNVWSPTAYPAAWKLV